MIYAYKEIKREEQRIAGRFENLPIDGKRTSKQTIRQVREMVLDMTYGIAQKCNIIVSYPKMSIQGQKVVLGEALILLPDCKLVSWETLKEIEENHIRRQRQNGKR